MSCTKLRSNLSPSHNYLEYCRDEYGFFVLHEDECRYCKGRFNAGCISSHQKKCTQRTIKCPDCSEVLVLQKWMEEHECEEKVAQGETCSSESSTLFHENKIQEDYKQMFLKQENCDVIIRVKGQEFPAHKMILAARSTVLASTFRNDMKEKKTNTVDIEDCDPSTFPDFLGFLYYGDGGIISAENVFSLFTAADKYNVPDLRGKCIAYMKENLSLDNFCETITIALLHTETELIHLATNFFIANAENIIKTAKWQSFITENPIQGNELFIKFVDSDRCVKPR